MLWQLLCLILLLFCACSHPFRDVSCLGEAPYSPADPWDYECEGWRQCHVEEPEVTVQDYSQEKTITELMDLALRNNPTTKKFWAQARADAYAYEQSKALFYPQVDLTYAVDNTQMVTALRDGLKFGPDGTPRSTNYYYTWTNEMNISWLLFDFGGREFNMMAFKMALYASNWNHAQSIQNVMNLVLSTYYTFLESQALAKAKELDVRDSKVNVEVAKLRFTAGLGTKVDVLQAESTLANSLLQLELLNGQVKIDLGRLATALGLPANAPLKLKDLPSQLPYYKNSRSLDELVEIAKSARADLNSFQAQYQERYYDYQNSLAQFWPKFVANYNRTRLNYTHSPITRSWDYDLKIALEVPLFHGFNDWYFIKNQRELTYEAYEAWAEQDQQVTLDVLTAYYNVEIAAETLKFSEEFLRFSEEAYQLALESYKVGISSYTDLLTSQSQLSTARSTRIVDITGYVSSLSSLAYAAGILSVTEIPEGIDLQKKLNEIQQEAVKYP